MTINELFAQINGKVSAVNGIVYSLTDPYRYEIDKKYYIANAYLAEIFNMNWHRITAYDRRQNRVLQYLMWSYSLLIDEYDYAISEMRSAMERSFAEYYSSIIYTMEAAVTETWNEIARSVAVVDNRVDLVKTTLESRIESEVEASESWLEGLIDNVKVLLDVDISALWDGIATKAGEIYTYIAEESASIYSTISEWVDDLWAYVGAFIEWVEEEFSAYYTAVQQWILDKAAEIYAVIETTVKDLTGFINKEVGKVWQQIINVQTTLKGMIADLEKTLRGWVIQGMDEIGAVLTSLSVLTDWRFQFLNIFMSKPELSILQVLNRDDAMFEKYKPYWQALFARVMAEE